MKQKWEKQGYEDPESDYYRRNNEYIRNYSSILEEYSTKEVKQNAPSGFNTSLRKDRNLIVKKIFPTITALLTIPVLFSVYENHSHSTSNYDNVHSINAYNNIIDVHGDGDLGSSIVPLTKNEQDEFNKGTYPKELIKNSTNSNSVTHKDQKDSNTIIISGYNDSLTNYSKYYLQDVMDNNLNDANSNNQAFSQAIKNKDVPIIINHAKFLNQNQVIDPDTELNKDPNNSSLCYINPVTYNTLLKSSGTTQTLKNTTFHCEYSVMTYSEKDRMITLSTSLSND